MTRKKWTLTDRELEELLYELIRFLKDWCLWESVSISCFPAGKHFTSYAREKAEAPQGLREIPDVWISEYYETWYESDYLGGGQNTTMVIFCEGETPLNDLMDGYYRAKFTELSDDAQQFILRHEELLELEDWYELYLDEPQLDDTEFDSYEEYREMEDERQNAFKKELTESFLSNTWRYDGSLYRRGLAKLIVQKFNALLDKYHQKYWRDVYSGEIVVSPRFIEECS